MIRVSKVITDCYAASQLSQSYPTFGIRGVPAPLLPHVGARHKASHPPVCKHTVDSGF